MQFQDQNVVLCLQQRERGGGYQSVLQPRLDLLAEEHMASCSEFNNQGCTIPGYPKTTFLMAFSPDGTKMASTHGDHNVHVTDLRTGQCTKSLMGHPRTPWCLAFHPSSNEILASGCLSGVVKVWDLHGGSETWESDYGTAIASLAFHPTDHVLVIATFNELFFWNWTEPRPFASCKTATEREKIRFVKFDPLGHFLFTGISNPPSVQTGDYSSDREAPHRYAGQSWSESEQSRTIASRRTITPELLQHYRNFADRYREWRDQIYGQTSQPAPSIRADPDEMRHSPTQEDALQDAREYASYVSHESQRRTRVHESILEGLRNRMRYARLRYIPRHQQARYLDMRERQPESESTGTEEQISTIPSQGQNSVPDAQGQASEPVLHEPTDASASEGQVGVPVVQRQVGISAPLGRSSAEVAPPHRTSELENLLRASDEDMQQEMASQRVRFAEILRQHVQNPEEDAGPGQLQPGGSTSRLQPEPTNSETTVGRMWLSQLTAETQRSGSQRSGSLARAVAEYRQSESHLRLLVSSVIRSWAVQDVLSRLQAQDRQGHGLLESRRTQSDDYSQASTSSGHVAGNVHTMCNQCGGRLDDEPGSSRESTVYMDSVASSSSQSVSSLLTPGMQSTEQSVSGAQGCHSAGHPRGAKRSHCNAFSKDASTAGPSQQEGAKKFHIAAPDGSATVSASRDMAAVSDTSTLSADEPESSPSSSRPQLAVSDAPALSQSSTTDRMIQAAEPSSSSQDNGQQDVTVTSACSVGMHSLSTLSPAPSDQRQTGLRVSVPSRYYSPPQLASTRDPSRQIVNDADVSLQNMESFPSCLLEALARLQRALERHSHCLSFYRNEAGAHLRERIAVILERVQNLYNRNIDNIPVREIPARVIESIEERHERLCGRLEEMTRRLTSPPNSAASSGYLATVLEEAARPAAVADVEEVEEDEEDEAAGTSARQLALLSELREVRQQLSACLDRLMRTEEESRQVQRYQAGIQRRDEPRLLGYPGHMGRSVYLQPVPGRTVSQAEPSGSNREDALQSAINRAIAGAFAVQGEPVMANRFTNLTHRIQRWDFRQYRIPDISDANSNLLVGHCRIHNDANCDISADGRLMACFIPNTGVFPNDTILAVYSLDKETLGQCLYTHGFGPNAISVCISPCNQFVLVGLAARRFAYSPYQSQSKQLMAQIFRLDKTCDEVGMGACMTHMNDIVHPLDRPSEHVSANSARWLPGAGEGLVYGTNKGHLHMCRLGSFLKREEAEAEEEEGRSEESRPRGSGAQGGRVARPASVGTRRPFASLRDSSREELLRMLRRAWQRSQTAFTQTQSRSTQTTSTQTDEETDT
ncbi:PREDICTED: activating molecule in BECN1-regulated autophagy protein 1-like isoform X2 [Priapulus caudatus]|uniref:Activating molecule in BECN1-regulated autophagy protein 1-like isoform X2 n=1 Tax=Priapulus caudatus TaxID=37621 RepID=A0ABM1DSL6_PRICU|nr:PREDICTED: activating molecule in BECN1-regulated autophagy protein 1-like isoform X2 [Priapulus caudatus]